MPYRPLDDTSADDQGSASVDRVAAGDTLRSQPRRRWNPIAVALAASLSANLLLLQWLALTQATTLRDFVEMTTPLYAWATLLSALMTSLVFGIAATKLTLANRGTTDTLLLLGLGLGAIFQLLSSGCPICGAPLLTSLGVSQGLRAFPLQGLDLKLIAGLLLWSVWWVSGRMDGRQAPMSASAPLSQEDVEGAAFRARLRVILGVITLLSLAAILLLPSMPSALKIDFGGSSDQLAGGGSIAPDGVERGARQIQEFSLQAYRVNAAYGDIGPRLLETGAIDYDRFLAVYERSNNPLTLEQREILRSGSDARITIDPSNAHFLLNFFWAFGLSNQNPILEEGLMVKHRQGDIGRFASTGGWTVGKSPGSEMYSSSQILTLSHEQQELVESVASRVYRPCCNNHAAFPDCNHGMAMLGVLEVLAAAGATEAEMLEAAKQFNAFWFSGQMAYVVAYFDLTQGWSFEDIPGELAVGPAVFSGSGYQSLLVWLTERDLLQPDPGAGASCGV